MSKKFRISTVDFENENSLGGVTEWPWGPVKKVHEFVPLGFAFVEYYPQVFDDGRGTGRYAESKTEVGLFVDGKDCHQSFNTLEQAMVGALAARSYGSIEAFNNRSAIYACKCLGLATDDPT